MTSTRRTAKKGETTFSSATPAVDAEPVVEMKTASPRKPRKSSVSPIARGTRSARKKQKTKPALPQSNKEESKNEDTTSDKRDTENQNKEPSIVPIETETNPQEDRPSSLKKSRKSNSLAHEKHSKHSPQGSPKEDRVTDSSNKTVETPQDGRPTSIKKRRKSKSHENHSTHSAAESPHKDEGTESTGERSLPPAPATKPDPSMDVSVHRVRHLNYSPKPIVCLASTPFDSHAGDYVALSRDNGNVELRSPDDRWKTVATVTGMSTRTVDVMAWTCGSCSDERGRVAGSTLAQTHARAQSRRTLLGASRDGTIFVIDFAHGRTAAVTGSGGGGVFSLVSLCGKNCCSESSCPQLVAAGCQDGSIRIYHVAKDDASSIKLELVSTVPCAGTAVLSLAWQRTKESSLGGSVLYAGVADGTIRRLDCVSTKSRHTGTSISTGTVVSNETQAWKSTLRMTLESHGRSTPTRVWALHALADGTLVSGDSLGHVQLWDGNSGTLIQSFDQNDNKADVLSLAVSGNDCRVFASGVDSRVICIERPVTVPTAGPPKWVMTHAQRPHTHDVKAMAMCKQRDKNHFNELLCSGGVDTKLCTYATKDFGKVRPKIFYPWPCVSPVSMASESRILVMQREDRVDLYKLAPSANVTRAPLLVAEDETLIGTIEMKGKHNIVCADISSDGRFLLVSNSTGLTMFRLDYTDDGNGRLSLQPRKVEIAPALRIPSLAVKFVTKNRIACASFDGPIYLLKIDEDSEGLTLQHTFPASTANFAIHSLHASAGGAWLAAERHGIDSGTVQVYSIFENACKHWWSLPALEAPVTCTRFIGGEKPTLVVACTNCSFYVFDVQERRRNSWSEQLGIPMSTMLPEELKHRTDCPVRVAFNPSTPHMFLLVSSRVLLAQRKNVISARLFEWRVVLVTLARSKRPFFVRQRDFSRVCGIV
jgi:U3 small nucleolar RNA-associated protein 4